jgi:hypothetical protein
VTTLLDALGVMGRPLARVIAQWHNGPAWRRAAVRAVYPDLARALEELEQALEDRTRLL